MLQQIEASDSQQHECDNWPAFLSLVEVAKAVAPAVCDHLLPQALPSHIHT